MQLNKSLRALISPDITGEKEIKKAIEGLKTYRLNINVIKRKLEEDGKVYIVEPLITYNKFTKECRLTNNPGFGETILKVLRFEPSTYREAIRIPGVYSTGSFLTLRDRHVGVLVIAKTKDLACSLRGSLEELQNDLERRNDFYGKN